MNNSLVNIFEKNAEAYPDKVAVFFDGKKLTYQELNERSNQVARHLLKADINSGDIVGLLFDRSLDFMVALWGVLKVGASYLPLDPNLPEQRIIYMLEQCNSKNIITQSKYAKHFEEDYTIHTIDSKAILTESLKPFKKQKNNSEFAYCIFTSGSTGYPKGVLMRQGSVVNLVNGLQERIYEDYEDQQLRIALVASFSFDASVQQIFAAFLLGHSLYILDDDSRKDGKQMLRFFNQHQINASDGTPTHLRLLLKANGEEATLETLSSWMLAGEVLEKNVVLNFYKKYGLKTQLFNLYGPTETCVDSTCYKIEFSQLHKFKSIPIGTPLLNERIYITGDNGEILTEGETGELCIAGAGLAVGYINDFELTTEKFRKDWLEEDRVYRTGDVGQLLADGNILFKGRRDNQIKLRGYRIELSEIETQLDSHPLINHVVVQLKKVMDEDHLVAYYVSEQSLEPRALRKFLISRLPNYMVPTYFEKLAELPLTISGKVDRKALPDIQLQFGKTDEDLSQVEKKIINIWSSILEVPEKKINRKSNFFQLGGNSLKSILIANRIKEEFGVQVSLAQFFDLQDVLGFTDFIFTSTTVNQDQGIVATPFNSNPPLTQAQKSFYFLDALSNEKSLAYNIPQVFILSGAVSLIKLKAAFNQLIRRHEVLRTAYWKDDSGLKGEIFNELEFDLTPLTFKDNIETTFLNFIKPFDLSNAPLIRAGYYKLDEKQLLLVLDIHHIISDEISNSILLDELMKLYQGLEIAKPKLQYRDYAVWQQSEEYNKQANLDQSYWMDTFAEAAPILDLPADYARPAKLTEGAHVYNFALDHSLCSKVRTYSSAQNVTTFNVLLAAYNILLSKLTSEEDIVVGTPVSGRNHKELEDVVGLFVNTLALRNQPKKDLSFNAFIKALQEHSSEALGHQSYAYMDLIGDLNLSREPNRNPLFDVFFTFNQEIDKDITKGEAFTISLYEMPFRSAKFDLTLEVLDGTDEIKFALIGHKDLFKVDTVKRFGNYFLRIIEQAITQPEQSIQEIKLLSDQDKENLLAYNQIETILEKSVIDIFSDQVDKTPESYAVEYNDVNLTYKELDQQSNQLANYLIEQGVEHGQTVGIYMDRSIEMIISLLAILKVGAAYVPFDPDAPNERTAFLLNDSKVQCVLTQSHYTDTLDKLVGLLIPVDTIQSQIAACPASAPIREIRPDDLMYIIYTSGSTGRPKGVMVEHRSLVNMSMDQVDRFGVTTSDKVLQFAALTFDASISEILMALFSGATLVMVDKEVITDSTSFIDFMYQRGVSVVTLPPAYLKVLGKEALTFLRCIITAGEAAMAEDARFLSQYVDYHNAYGPTECAVCISSHQVDSQSGSQSQIPIGKPIKNLQVLILDANNELCPPGVAGELCVSGVGVARGYWNRSNLTKQKFVDNPLDNAVKMYRTGDYVKWNDNGQLEYIGRKDNQVKIRGFRVELGEIESVLDEYVCVKQVSVQLLENDNGNKIILAFVVPGKDYDLELIYNHINSRLPSYMKPSQVISVDHIPLTLHGKVDKNALLQQYKPVKSYLHPVNETEEQLLALWMEELGAISTSNIGTQDNFFKVGGNSLIAMQLIARINESFNTDLTLNDLFRHQTIAQIAKQIEFEHWLNDSSSSNGGKRIETIL